MSKGSGASAPTLAVFEEWAERLLGWRLSMRFSDGVLSASHRRYIRGYRPEMIEPLSASGALVTLAQTLAFHGMGTERFETRAGVLSARHSAIEPKHHYLVRVWGTRYTNEAITTLFSCTCQNGVALGSGVRCGHVAIVVIDGIARASGIMHEGAE